MIRIVLSNCNFEGLQIINSFVIVIMEKRTNATTTNQLGPSLNHIAQSSSPSAGGNKGKAPL